MFVATHHYGFNDVIPSIEYVGGKTFDVDGNTSTDVISLTDLTGGLGPAPVTGDVVIVAYGFGNNTDENVAVTTGYTELADLYQNDTGDVNLGGYLKVMGAPTDTSLTVGTSGGTDNRKTGVIQVYRGVDITTPQDAAATTAGTTNSVLANPAAITPVTIGAVVVAMGAGAHFDGTQTFSSSDLLNFVSEGSSDVFSCTVGMGWIGPWATGAVNPAAFTYSTADDVADSWAAITLALRPKF